MAEMKPDAIRDAVCENDTDVPKRQGGGGCCRNTCCPVCGQHGKEVSATTLRHLLLPDLAADEMIFEGFRFCATAACEIVYYHPVSAVIFRQQQLQVPVWQKGDDPARLVCYCFQHSVAEIEHEVITTGSSAIMKTITHQCQDGRARCEETNPQGSCCLGNIRQVVRAAQSQHPAIIKSSPDDIADQPTCPCCREKT